VCALRPGVHGHAVTSMMDVSDGVSAPVEARQRVCRIHAWDG
jgi:hypothetical protein